MHKFNSIEEALEDLRKGKMIIVVDDDLEFLKLLGRLRADIILDRHHLKLSG